MTVILDQEQEIKNASYIRIQTTDTRSLRCNPGRANLHLPTHLHGGGCCAYAQAVYIGDTITCTVTFDEKDEEKRLFRATATSVNQDGVEVLKSSFSGFPADVRLAR